MRILELLLPKGASDRSLSPQVARKIDALQQRMDGYVDKIMDPKTSLQGKEFLKSRLRDDYYELKDVLPRVHHVAENDIPTQYEVYDKRTGQAVPKRGPYNDRSRANRAVDQLDNAYGAYRYGYRPIGQKLEELFQGGKDWKLGFSGSEEFEAKFVVAGIPYKFYAYRIDTAERGIWDVEFGIDKRELPAGSGKGSRYGITGDTKPGESAEVFSIVVDIMRAFIQQNKNAINTIILSAKEPSRQKLYKRMISRLLPDWKMEDDGIEFAIHKPKAQVTEAVHKLPLSDDDFKFVKKLMLKPIPAVIAPIYILEIIDDDELNDTLLELENSDPGMDIRPIVVEWIRRVMPDQMYRFTDDVGDSDQKEGRYSVVHGYDPKMYKGTNDPITGNAYGSR